MMGEIILQAALEGVLTVLVFAAAVTLSAVAMKAVTGTYKALHKD